MSYGFRPLGIKKVPFKLQLKWNKQSEQAEINRLHTEYNTSVTFLTARFNYFANLLAKNFDSRRIFA